MESVEQQQQQQQNREFNLESKKSISTFISSTYRMTDSMVFKHVLPFKSVQLDFAVNWLRFQ